MTKKIPGEANWDFDVHVDENGTYVTVEMTGAEPDNVKVDAFLNRVEIFHYPEGKSSQKKTVFLPKDVDFENCVAQWNNGFLDVRIPRNKRNS